jgi:hypothetical protein
MVDYIMPHHKPVFLRAFTFCYLSLLLLKFFEVAKELDMCISYHFFREQIHDQGMLLTAKSYTLPESQAAYNSVWHFKYHEYL